MTAETTRLSIFGMKHHYKLKILINIFLVVLLPFVFLTCSPMIEDFNSLVKENGSDNIQFTVEYYADGVDTDEVDYSTPIKASHLEIGSIDSFSSPQDFSGFTYQSKSIVQDSNGNYILKLIYRRKNITLSFDISESPNGAQYRDGSTIYSITRKFGASTENSIPTQDDMTFTDPDSYFLAGWENSLGETCSIEQFFEQTFPAANATYFAKWVLTSNGANYNVQYWFEKWDLGNGKHYLETNSVDEENFNRSQYAQGENATEPSQKMAEIGSEITVSIPEYVGFTAIDPESLVISDDSDANIIKVYYYRKEITLTYKSDSDDAVTNGAQNDEYGVFTEANGGGTSKTVTGYYGDTIALKYTTSDVEKSTFRKTWECTSWSPAPASETFPAVNEVYTAQWNQTHALYTVKYYFEDTTSGTSIWVEDEDKTYREKGLVGQMTTVSAAAQDSVEGYYAPTVTNVTIVANATSVVRVEYKSKASTSSGMINPGTTDITLTVEVTGTTITASCTRSGTDITSCTWYLNGVAQSGTSSSFTKNDVSAGTYTLFVVAKDGYAEYTASATVTVQ